MTDLASSVVQVVTSGADWPAVVAAISGGVVGLAGIVFAWHQSKITISAEDARAKVAEKRRIYANCLAALSAYSETATAALRGTQLPPAQRAELLEDSYRARLAAVNATSEVDLIAPTEVAVPAHRAVGVLLNLDHDTVAGDIAEAITKVMLAMRSDLGEHVPTRKQDEMRGRS